MERIVFLDRGTIGPSVEMRRPQVPHVWVEHERTAPDQVVERLKDATVAVLNKVPLRESHLQHLPSLRLVAVAATGYDVVDTDACRQRGIAVSNVRGYAARSVPEHTFALILALKRSLIGYRRDVENGEWQRQGQFCFFNHPIGDLADSTLGIIGEGVIGQSVAALATAFGMRPLFAAHKGVSGLGPLYTPFEQVLAESDIITLHCPLLPRTRNLLAMPEFRQMVRRPLLINTARGGLVDEKDLVSAMDEGLISGFGFDCLVAEPPAVDDPMLACLKRPNVIITPHTAWASAEAMQALWNQVIDQIDRFSADKPFNRVV